MRTTDTASKAYRYSVLHSLALALCIYGCQTEPSENNIPSDTVELEPIDLSIDQSNSQGPLLTNGPGPNVIATVICDDVGIGSGIRLEVSPSAACEAERQYPYLHMSLFDLEFREQPEGYWYWPEYEVSDENHRMLSRVGGYYCPSEDECEFAYIAIYVEQWEAERFGPTGWSSDPEILIGQPVLGWYVIELRDGTQIGNAFDGIYCGQNWDYCD